MKHFTPVRVALYRPGEGDPFAVLDADLWHRRPYLGEIVKDGEVVQQEREGELILGVTVPYLPPEPAAGPEPQQQADPAPAAGVRPEPPAFDGTYEGASTKADFTQRGESRS